MANWNSTGYDLSRSARWIYAFLSSNDQTVKVGLVLTEDRLGGRLKEVSRKHPDVVQVAASAVHDQTHQEAEHVEAVVRHWLCASAGFRHSGLVDWLEVPDPGPADWQQLLDEAVRAALTFGSPKARP